MILHRERFYALALLLANEIGNPINLIDVGTPGKEDQLIGTKLFDHVNGIAELVVNYTQQRASCHSKSAVAPGS